MNMLKPECPCGCGKFGNLTKAGHSHGCKCRSCVGRRSRTQGLKKQRHAKKLLGVPSNRFHGQDGNEENWRGLFRIEVKSGKQVGHAKWFFRAEAQSDANRAIGDSRPFLFVAMPEGMGSEGFVTLRLSDWQTHIVPRIEEAS
jgi:hypothetical protein